MCVFTVSSDINRRLAIGRFACPVLTSRTTSSSLSVSEAILRLISSLSASVLNAPPQNIGGNTQIIQLNNTSVDERRPRTHPFQVKYAASSSRTAGAQPRRPGLYVLRLRRLGPNASSG